MLPVTDRNTSIATSGLGHPYHLDWSIPSFRGFWWLFEFLLHFPLKILSANSVDPKKTPRLAASELGLHCLHNTTKLVSDLKRLNGNTGPINCNRGLLKLILDISWLRQTNFIHTGIIKLY